MLVVGDVDTGESRHRNFLQTLLRRCAGQTPDLTQNVGLQKASIQVIDCKSQQLSQGNQPWRCLCRGSLEQITRTTPLRRTTLQLRHIFFTEALTFIAYSCPALA